MSTRRFSPWLIVALAAASLVVVAASALFMFGEDLFGSDPDTIDDYNKRVLESCELPDDATLVRTYILTLRDSADRSVRSMSYIWALPLPAANAAEFYGASGPGTWAKSKKNCKSRQHPAVLVLESWTAGGNPIDRATQTSGPDDAVANAFWAPEGAAVTDHAAVPDATQSFLLLRLGQREVEGLFSLVQTPTANTNAQRDTAHAGVDPTGPIKLDVPRD
jgi:hypothetical protein